VTVYQSSFGRAALIVRTCCGTPTISGGRDFHVPASNRAMYVSFSCATNSVFASGDQMIPCGCLPTGMRAVSFIEMGSMTDVVLAMRLLTAMYLPSGETDS
jgi:hypothetical protein